jgi:membrane fusion protein (multidrug efflux system)
MRIRVRILGFAFVAVIVAFVVYRMTRPGEEEAEITPDVAVHVGEIGRATLHRYVTAYGTVEPEPALNGRPAAGALITPFVDGVLSSIDVVEGRRVTKGTVLFRLDSRMAEVEVQRARDRLAFADSAFRRQEALLGSDGTSRKDYLDARQLLDQARSELAAAETGLAYLNIEAPLSGTVLHLAAEVGRHVDAGSVLAHVVDLGRLVVTAGVPAREIEGIAVGQGVLLGRGDSVPAGKVLVLGRDIDRTTGTYRVQASLPASAGLMPGQFTDIRIVAAEHAHVLVVPEESVVSRGDEGSWIILVQGDSAVRHPVTVGLRDGGRVEVSGEGLREGMTIVTVEAYSLPETTRIHIVSD